MSDDTRPLTPEELERQEAEELPPKEAMSLIDPSMLGQTPIPQSALQQGMEPPVRLPVEPPRVV